MNEVPRSGQAKLRVFLVVAGVGEVIRVAELDESGVFNAAIFFVVGFRRKHRLGTACEVEAITALGVAEAGDAILVLRAIEHDKFAVVEDDGGIESAGGLPSCTSGPDGGLNRNPPEEGKVQVRGRREYNEA